MHIDKINERRGLSKLVGLAVAGATLLAGMVALPATQASAFPSADGFEEGAISGTVPTLTVTKFLSSNSGLTPTGSSDDLTIAQGSGTPAKDIVFNVREVVPKPGETIATIDPGNTNTYDPATPDFYAAGTTNGQGVINSWQKADPTTGAPTATSVTFPSGLHYYVLTENRSVSPAFLNNTIDPNKYTESAPSFFGLPYRTKDTVTGKTGYIYNLHVYPKNVSKSSLNKSVTAINGSTDAHIAVAGDTISYKVTQKLYNQGASSNTNDGKLDVSELAGGYNDLRIVDRMGSSLSLQSGTVNAKITWPGGGSKVLNLGSDWRFQAPQANKFKRVVNNDDMFASDPANIAKYSAFEFFDNLATLKPDLLAIPATELTLEVTYDAKVTANGDSTSTGGVSNAVESDFSDNKNGGGPLPPPGGGTTTPSGTVAFGKLQKNPDPAGSGNVPVEGAVFRLTDPSDPAKYLATDGSFYADNTNLPAGTAFYTATSSPTGSVVFTGLPILDSARKGIAGDWDVIEYTAPSGLDAAPNPFRKVHFGSSVVGKTEEEIVNQYGSSPIEPIYSELKFGTFAGNPPASPVQFNGHDVEKNMMNYKRTDPDSPVGLPLTGGRGIILLLVAGVIIMGGALYVRSRRNAARA